MVRRDRLRRWVRGGCQGARGCGRAGRAGCAPAGACGACLRCVTLREGNRVLGLDVAVLKGKEGQREGGSPVLAARAIHLEKARPSARAVTGSKLGTLNAQTPGIYHLFCQCHLSAILGFLKTRAQCKVFFFKPRFALVYLGGWRPTGVVIWF